MDPKQAIFVGLGWLEHSQERIEELVEELVERGQLTRKEAARFIKQVMDQARGEKEEFRRVVQEMLRDSFNSAGVATKNDLSALSGRLDALEAKLKAAGGKKKTAKKPAAKKPPAKSKKSSSNK